MNLAILSVIHGYGPISVGARTCEVYLETNSNPCPDLYRGNNGFQQEHEQGLCEFIPRLPI